MRLNFYSRLLTLRNPDGGSELDLACWAVITSATEPMMMAAANAVRPFTLSPAKSAPRSTATTGFT
jgi:hypothetical protein